MDVNPSMCFCIARKPLKKRSSKLLKAAESTPPMSSRYSRGNLKGADSKLMLNPGESSDEMRCIRRSTVVAMRGKGRQYGRYYLPPSMKP